MQTQAKKTGLTANIGKIPGAIHEVEIDSSKPMNVKALFEKIGVSLEKCELQKNGVEIDENAIVEAGDNVLAITKIKGN